MSSRVIVLSGAASGIGYAAAERFLSAGDTVIGLDIADTVPDGVTFHHVDVADKGSVDAAIGSVGDEHGRIDVLLNVAGISQFGRVETIDEAEWDRVLAVDLKGQFLVTQAALPMIRAAREVTGTPGNIVNVASISGIRAQPYTAAYSAAKGGVVMLTKSLAIELADEGIRVNCVCPGMVDTPLVAGVAEKITADVNERAMDRMMMLLPHGAMQPAEIAEALFYLAGAPSVTGVALPLDGGMDA